MDAAFVTEATDFMKKELKKQNPDMKKVEDSMLRTTAARRKSIELDSMSLTDVVGLYPALTLEKEILNECRRLTGVSPDEALLRALREFSEHILNAAAQKRAAQTTLCSLQADMSVDNRIARNYAKGVGAIMVLPFLVNERGGEIFTEMTPGKEFTHPTLLYTGENPVSSEAMCVKCEDVCVDVLDFTSGLSLLFAMYWAHNIE
ncbi:uncharacterized protein LOC119397284 [Rhipicephalus sanguineus]|uniref:uncharacterized protein LOC119397284 n=1 Tax=Rhipicephalus sanguineus TaxID=34632 RepID=UPI001895F12D|nr:uncharacterized protein LOC119397284 [Rhipicephalus sanguineus]